MPLALSDGLTLEGVVARAGQDPEKMFRFVAPAAPYENEQDIYVSSHVVKAAGIPWEALTAGTLVEVTIKLSTDRHGDPSWSATTIKCLGRRAPVVSARESHSRSERGRSQPTHVGAVDGGGVQHLANGDAWFLEDVVPYAGGRNVKVNRSALTGRAASDPTLLRPGALVMFRLEGWQRAMAADIFDPHRASSDLLVHLLGARISLPDSTARTTIDEIVRRGDTPKLEPTWQSLGRRNLELTCDALRACRGVEAVLRSWAEPSRVLRSLQSEDLEQIDPELLASLLDAEAPNCDEVRYATVILVKALDRQGRLDLLKRIEAPSDDFVATACACLEPTNAIAVFGDHPVLWATPSTAAVLLRERVSDLSIDSLAGLSPSGVLGKNVWEKLAAAEPEWISTEVSSAGTFNTFAAVETPEAVEAALGALRTHDRGLQHHLVPWVPRDVLAKWLGMLSPLSEPDDTLIHALIGRRARTSEVPPMPVRAWSPVFWDADLDACRVRLPEDEPSREAAIGRLLEIVDYHVFRLRQNRQDDWSMGLLAEAIGGLVHARPASFSDAYSWAETPVDWVGRVLDAFGEFFSMDSAVHSREPSGTWKPTQAFKGPSRVWLQRHALAESWDTLSPNEKLLAVFLHLSAPDRYPLQVDSHLEQHPMVRSVLLLRHGASDDSRGATALQAHELIADAVLVRVPKPKSRVAIHPDELEIDFERALPLCRVLGSGVKYCEGRHMSKPPFDAWKRWKDDPHGNVRPISVAIFRDTEDPIDCQCPRLERARGYRDSGCQVLTDGAEGHAHLFARRKLPWSRWTLLEALEACGYPPNLIEIFQRRGDKPRIEPPVAVENEYVNKIAGTLNRINELRDRLRCGWRDGEIDPAKGCGQPLAPQFEYSKFPAAYGITVWGSCSASNEGGPHDAGCYFSHCFRCMGTIDNRESPIRDGTSNRLYVCAHCGGWSRQQGTESNALYPGEFRRCGKCGSDDSILDRECKLVICGNAACAHTWRPFDKIWSQL